MSFLLHTLLIPITSYISTIEIKKTNNIFIQLFLRESLNFFSNSIVIFVQQNF